jgi:hypothetical protein
MPSNGRRMLCTDAHVLTEGVVEKKACRLQTVQLVDRSLGNRNCSFNPKAPPVLDNRFLSFG